MAADAALILGVAPQGQAESGAWVSLRNPCTKACRGISTAIAGARPVTQVDRRVTHCNSWHLDTDGRLRNGYRGYSCLDKPAVVHPAEPRTGAPFSSRCQSWSVMLSTASLRWRRYVLNGRPNRAATACCGSWRPV